MNTLLNFFNQAIKRNGKDCTINSIIFKAIFKDIIVNDNRTSIDSKYLITDYNLLQGDIITCNAIKYFIITKNENINNVYNVYTIQKAFQTVNLGVGSAFYKKDTILNSSSTTIDYNTYINLLNGHLSMLVQSDSITNQIELQSRFIKFGHVWKITSIDKSKDGLLTILADLDTIGAGDDLVNEIPNGGHMAVTNINVVPDEITLQPTQTEQLSVTVDVEGTIVENPTLTYSSSDTNIATVSENGLVTCIVTGDCNIIVTYTDIDGNITTKSVPFSTVLPKTFKIVAPTDYDSEITSHGAYEIFTSNTEPLHFEFYAMQGSTQTSDTFTLTYSYSGAEYTISSLTGNSFGIFDNEPYFDDYIYITCTDNQDNTVVGTIIIEIGGAW